MKKILFLLISTIFVYGSSAFVTPSDVKKKLLDTNFIVLDVTDSETYKKGHIPYAVNVDVSNFRKKVGKYQLMKSSKKVEALVQQLGINNSSKVVIYGHGKPKELLKSSYMALVLKVNGLKDVSLLDGGYDEWIDEYERLILRESPPVIEGKFVAKFNPNILVDLNYVYDSIGKIDMIESRPSRFYYGKERSSGVARLGHIPFARTSFWRDKFDSANGILDKSILHKIFYKQNRLLPEQEVIVYCTGGLEASMNWFILSEYLGFTNVKLYDASMREWGNKSKTPLTVEDF